MTLAALNLKEDEEPYGEAKIIPISPKARDYLLQIKPDAKPRKLYSPIKPSKKGRHNSRLITELYNRFVAPHYPSVMRASRQFFLKHTIPFLLNCTCPQATAILSGAFYQRHAKVFKDCGKTAHMRQTLIAIASHKPPPLLPHLEAAMGLLKTERQLQTLRILANLSEGRKEFFLSCRDLQARLLLPTSATAHRLLEKLCRTGILQRLTSGTSKQRAREAGEAAMAATFSLKGPV